MPNLMPRPWSGDLGQLPDQELMHQYESNILWIFGVTDFLAAGPADTLPEPELRQYQDALAEWRDLGAELHAELCKRGILG